MIDYESVVDAMLFESRVAMLDGEMLEVEPCQFSDCMTHVMEKLRQAERDAARYLWLRDKASGFAIENAADICREAWDSLIDDAMKSSSGGNL